MNKKSNGRSHKVPRDPKLRWVEMLFNLVENIRWGFRMKEAIFNEDDKTVKIFMKGRPVILHAPTDLADSYEITKVCKNS